MSQSPNLRDVLWDQVVKNNHENILLLLRKNVQPDMFTKHVRCKVLVTNLLGHYSSVTNNKLQSIITDVEVAVTEVANAFQDAHQCNHLMPPPRLRWYCSEKLNDEYVTAGIEAIRTVLEAHDYTKYLCAGRAGGTKNHEVWFFSTKRKYTNVFKTNIW